jgi:hypothetical protein
MNNDEILIELGDVSEETKGEGGPDAEGGIPNKVFA